jgi:hypothetical protein
VTFSKFQNLSPPRRYIQLSSNFHKSRKGFYWSGDWTILERQITDDFSQLQTSKSISSEDIFAKWLKCLSSIPQNICKRFSRAFLQFQARTENMIFLVIFQKIYEKRKPVKHWWESWLTSRWYFEVLVVKFEQTLFFNFIFW